MNKSEKVLINISKEAFQMRCYRDTISNIPGFLLPAVFFLLGMVGLFSAYSYNIAKPDLTLELAFFVATLFMVERVDRGVILFLVSSFLYFSICFYISVVYAGDNYLDFLQAYKAFFYIVMLSLYVNKKVFDVNRLKLYFYILLFLFFVKYGYSLALDLTPRMGERPGLYVENNFELVFLLLLFYLCLDKIKNKSKVFLLLALVVFMSGSRSAALELFIIFFFAFFRRLSIKTILFMVVCVPIVLGVVAFIFLDRMDGGLENIDRYKFLLMFLSEVKSWEWWKWLVGTWPITPLSQDVCSSLSYYSSLYSYSGDGSCYSVILHSYMMRVIFDHGVLGFLFILSFVYYALRKSGFSMGDVLCVYGVTLTSSLSVSSYNSIFVALILAIYLSSFNRSSSR